MAVESRTEQTRDPSHDGSLVCFCLFVCLFGRSLAGCSADRLPTSRLFCPVFKLFSRSLAGRSTGCSPAARRFCLSGLLRRVRRVHWSVGPLVRRVHWRRRGSVDARTLPRPAPSACIEAAEKRAAARLGAGRRMHAARTSGPDADNSSSPHSKPACADLLRPEHPRTGCSLSGRLHSGRPLRTHFCRPLRPGRSVPDALLQTATPRTLRSGRTLSGRPAQAAPFRPSPLRRETPRDGF